MSQPAEKPTISNAQARWELENDVQTASDLDALYRFDAEEQKAIQASKPWARDPHFFKR
jgi:COP9 signalosome complex subunit 5